MKRERLDEKVRGGGSYFASAKPNLQFIPSGCKLLDLALGGGWAENRIANIVGDKSTGKTLLCIEAATNFINKYSNGKVLYRESEAAFDQEYAAALGMPIDKVDFGLADEPLETVEDLFEDLTDTIERAKRPTLYILDSLDALSDRAEMDRKIDAGTYGANKPKQVSELFRRLTKALNRSKVTLIIVSQERDKIGAVFGRKSTRSGGRALDFYASQVLWLAQTGVISRTIAKIKRTVGIEIKAKVDKNKVSLAFREAHFSIAFGYGIDDLTACLEWLNEAKSLSEIGISEKEIKSFVKSLMRASDSEYFKTMDEIHAVVERRWYEIEKSFLPTRRKYGG